MSFLEASSDAPRSALKRDPDWWRGAVIYQVYPRSFQDSNDDGIGDLSGIIHRLGYLRRLGVDAIWISPFFRSPMRDFGYDISSFRDVDPMFGSMGDFEALVHQAHRLGIRVLIDLVFNHTSSEHDWFKESRSSRDNPKSDWYVWADPRPDGTPPNNWLSIFGGPAWEWDSERMQYYLHNFLTEQPDLNFHCPEVQDELLDVARFWLDKGVDGFRLDVVNFYFHDADLRDNPALPVEYRNDNTAPSVNPYNFQDHLYDKTRPANLAFLQRLREVMDEYPDITSVGEIGESQRGMETQRDYTSNGRLHMAYDFDFLSGVFPSGSRIGKVLERFGRVVTEGWACWAFSNHDTVRYPTRWGLDDAQIRLYAAILMTLRGTVCLYQGEELGLGEAYVPFDELQDPYGKRFWPKFRGRDGCRTPMPWTTEHNGGFSDGRPWLPVAIEHVEQAVSLQDRDAGSVLNFYRAFIAFRKTLPVLSKGDFTVVQADDEVLSFIRDDGETRVFVAFNLAEAPCKVALPEGDWTIRDDAPFEPVPEGCEIHLPPRHGAFATTAAH
ncbi:alpha-glucosidase [Palleronia sediminis]|uniref:Alpha-glucosidase n=1 Tax=Palleronia sediminis TaxID=2547833 RepID=A0A4R6APV3_9RHOB|nr:alpha-glucosidase family protein [Palleronia sediminis]TDL83693.1 alpha-glucosidase [Palleronia sediminis]